MPRPPLLAALAAVLACAPPVHHEVPAPAPGQVCSADGWCWYAPLPSGLSLRTVWGSAWDDVWAAGNGLVHFDGTRWTMAASPLQQGETLKGLAGDGPRDVWALGDRLLRWDGQAWTEPQGPTFEDGFLAVASSGQGELWAVGDSGDGPDEQQTIVHHDASGWTVQLPAGPPDLRALWSPGPGECWAVGFDLTRLGPRTVHLEGGTWREVATPGHDALGAVWGSSRTDVWAGGGATLLHWDGQGWTDRSAELPAGAVVAALWGFGPAEVYAALAGQVLRFDGQRWVVVPGSLNSDPRRVRALWGPSDRDLWKVGDQGLLAQGDRGALVEVSRDRFNFLEAVTALGPADAWAVGGGGTALHWDGQAWSATYTGVVDPLQAVWASGPADVWAAGADGQCQSFILRWDGARWSTSLPSAPGACLSALGGTGPGDVWAAGTRTLLHFDGAGWGLEGPQDVTGAVVAAGDEVFALQDSIQGGATPPGGVYHRLDGGWTLEHTAATASLRALWSPAAGELWAAGDDGAFLQRRTAQGWAAVPSGLADGAAGLTALWGRAPDDVWAGSRSSGTLLHWDGRAWTPLTAASGRRSVTGLGGSADGGVWAVGGEGAILHHP